MIVGEHADEVHGLWCGILHFIKDNERINGLDIVDTLLNGSDHFGSSVWRFNVESHAQELE